LILIIFGLHHQLLFSCQSTEAGQAQLSPLIGDGCF